MQDLQNYQYYDPSPQPAPQPWWKRKRTWQLVGLLALAGVVLTLAIIAALNALKNRQLANGEVDLMGQADAIESQLGAECDQGDTACLERARADAARKLGVSQACDELAGESFATCVNLIAQDKQDPEVCKALAGDEQTTCLDTVYLLQANTNLQLATCDRISVGATAAACRTQVKATLVAAGKCTEAGVDASVCAAADTLEAAIATGDPAACAALVGEEQQYACEQGINSVDEDHDGLVLADEVELGLSDNLADIDADGLSDGDEVHTYATNPALADTDGDGYSDGVEVAGGYDPLK